MRHVFGVLCLAVLICALTKPGCAQSLTLSANPLNFQLDQDPTLTQTLTITTLWQGASSNMLNVCVYMTAPLVGTFPNTDTIAPTSVYVNNTALGGSSGKPQCGVHGATLISSSVVNLWGTRTDNASVWIAGYPATLAPDVYTGALNLVATTF